MPFRTGFALDAADVNGVEGWLSKVPKFTRGRTCQSDIIARQRTPVSRKLLILRVCRRWDLNPAASKWLCKLQILSCSECHSCHRCRKPLHAIARHCTPLHAEPAYRFPHPRPSNGSHHNIPPELVIRGLLMDRPARFGQDKLAKRLATSCRRLLFRKPSKPPKCTASPVC